MSRLPDALWVLALLLAAPAYAAQGFALRLDPAGLRGDDRAPLARFLYEAEVRLPPRVKAALGHPVHVAFGGLPSDGRPLVTPPCPGQGTPGAVPLQIGRSSRGADADRVTLHRDLLLAIQKGPLHAARYGCGHGDLYHLALATLLHEVLHLYDARVGISRNPYYQHLQGFDPTRSPQRARPRNELPVRSPDPYELHDIAENFAVHGEYFLLDPDYRCRRPAAYQFLEDALRHRPFPRATCQINYTVYAGDDRLILDPARVYQVHLLLASSGDEMASRFGHLMLRLVRCAPERLVVGPACLEDLHEHVVLGFAADLRGELTIDPLRGLFGGYPSLLFVKPLAQVIVEYTEQEFRALRSLPLRLSEDQRRQLVHRALEIHYTYAGRYYFFSNNCAVEALRLLQAVLPAPDVQALSAITPGGVLDDLVRLGVADPSAQAAPGIAARDGLAFPSLFSYYEGAFQALRPHLPRAAPSRLGRYLRASRAAERADWAATLLTVPARAAWLYSLEGLILIQRERVAERALLRYLYRGPVRDPRRRRSRALLDALVSPPPWVQARGGYGVPLAAELSPPPSRRALRASLLAETDQLLAEIAPREFAELRGTQANRRRFLHALLDHPMIGAKTSIGGSPGQREAQ